jgi:urea transport system permease protein
MRFSYDRFVAFAVMLLMLLAGPVARAANFEDALGHFTADDFSETTAGITEVAGSGNPLAAPVLQALHAGRLLFSADQKKVFYKDQSDKLFDAATGQAVAGLPTSAMCASTTDCVACSTAFSAP